MTDLLPCPFCGDSPHVDPNTLWAWCENKRCGVKWKSMPLDIWNKQGHSNPSDGLLASMALRYRHDFGILPADEQRTIMAIMRQIHEEVVGKGFYKPEHEEKYLRALNYE